MRAVQVVRLEGPQGVDLVDVPDPTPAAGETLVDVHAVGVSFPDLLLSTGEYQLKPELPFTLGVDFAGVVREAPNGSGFVSGNRVAGVLPHGGGSDVVAVGAGSMFPLPDNISLVQGAALPMNYLTAQFALATRGHVERGESVLVHGAAGGVGTACIQVAKGYGARVIAVVSTEEKGEFARAAGADDVVLLDGFLEQVKDLTDGAGVDIVVDVVGGEVMTDSLRSLTTQGRLLVVGFAAGAIPQVRVNRLLLNNVDVRGVGWGAFAMVRPGYLRRQWEELRPMMASGVVSPPIGATYPLEDVRSALTEMAERRTLGKSVLVLR